MKEHWEKVYQTKKDTEVSWYQDNPKVSLDLVKEHSSSKDASVIDVGGGNSNLVIELQKFGFEDLSVLDISGAA